MKRLYDAARARLSLLVSRRSAESRMDEELAFHVDMEAQRIARDHGVPLDEARRQARATFGGVTQHKETLRAGRGLAWLDVFSLDARLALRMLRKTPGLTAIAVLGMSVAVAIGCVCFSAVERIVDTRLPISEGDRVIGIRNIDTRRAREARATHLHSLPLWRESIKSLEDIGAYRNLSRTVTIDGASESARVAEMTASGFRITRVAPVMGRYFIDADERPEAPPVAVIGYRTWQQRYAGRPDILGQSIQISNTRHTIVGVMPETYAFPVNNRLWIPLRLNPAAYESFRAPSVDVFARLAPGATVADARREADLVGRRLATSSPDENADLRQRVIPYTHMFIDNADAAWMYHLIQLIVTALLAVIGTNVAVLVYARTAGRVGEIAVRTSLGASRARIVGQLFAEALALSLVAAGVGVFVAWLAMREIDTSLQEIIGPQLPYWLRFGLTPGVVLYAIGLAIIAAVIIGVVPALKITGGKFRATLAELSAGSSNLRLGRPWTIMIVAQVAIAVALLPLSISGINAWSKGKAVRAVVDAQQILTASVSYDLPEQVRMDSAETSIRHLSARAELIARLKADPRVATVFMASAAIGDEDGMQFDADPSSPIPVAMSQISANDLGVQPEYFRTIGIPVVAGRMFESGDLSSSASVVIVNRSFIRKMFGNRLAVGSRIRVTAKPVASGDTTKPLPWMTIVGVVSDFPVDSSVAAPRVYRPLAADVPGGVVIGIKMKGARATEFIPTLRRHAFATSPLLRLDGIRTMSQAFYDAFAELRLAVLVMELITLSVILLSAAGIYALMTFTVTRRRREIGIRAALGAMPRWLLVSEMGHVMRQISVGIVIGLIFAAAGDRMMTGDYAQKDLPRLAMVAAIMLVIGIVAALRPAIGALRIQPTEALRSE
jgi:putative ABC transport system permease protein